MFQRVTDLSAIDDKSFKMVLREPYGLIFEVFAKTSTRSRRELVAMVRGG